MRLTTPQFYLTRIIALYLSISLTLPSSAFALRAANPVEAGLEEKIAQKLEHSERQAGMEEVKEFQDLVEQVSKIFDAQEATGLLRKRIDEITADRFFTEAGVAFIPHTRGRVVVLGDRHGDNATLEKELELMKKETGYDPKTNKSSQEPLYLVFVGDYIDIGKQSLKTITKILRLKVEDPDHVVLLGGNHDRARLYDDSPDVVKHVGIPWLFRQIDQLVGGKGKGAAVYDRWNVLALRMPSMVVARSGLAVIHGSPPNCTVDAPEFGQRFDTGKGLLGVSGHPGIREQLSWNFVERATSEQQTAARGNTLFDPPMPNWQRGFWVGQRDFELFMESFGGKVLVRGHDSQAPWDWVPFGGRMLTLMGLDYRSPDNGYAVEKKIRARFAVFDLSRTYEKIDPKEVLRFAWESAAAGLEERFLDTTLPIEERRNALTSFFDQHLRPRMEAGEDPAPDQAEPLQRLLGRAGDDSDLRELAGGMLGRAGLADRGTLKAFEAALLGPARISNEDARNAMLSSLISLRFEGLSSFNRARRFMWNLTLGQPPDVADSTRIKAEQALGEIAPISAWVGDLWNQKGLLKVRRSAAQRLILLLDRPSTFLHGSRWESYGWIFCEALRRERNPDQILRLASALTNGLLQSSRPAVIHRARRALEQARARLEGKRISRRYVAVLSACLRQLPTANVSPSVGLEELSVDPTERERFVIPLTGQEPRLNSAIRIFDQVGLERLPPGVQRISLGTEIGDALVTFLNRRVGDGDVVLFRSDRVGLEQVPAWLPEQVHPAVIVGDPAQIQGLNAAGLEELVRLAAGRPGRMLIVQKVWLEEYKGRKFLLVEA